MSSTDAYLYDVTSPILHPVPARVGDLLAVRPGHPTHPVVVLRKVGGRWSPVDIGPPNYGAILLRETEGALTPVFASVTGLPLAEHPVVRSA